MRGIKILAVIPKNHSINFTNGFSTSSVSMQRHFKILIVGGGTGGCSVAQKFVSKLGAGKVGIIEPNDVHYYQPLWTLVGGGIRTLGDSATPMSKVLPKKADWMKTTAVNFDPKNNKVTLGTGEQVTYDFMVMATGVQLNFHLIKGLLEGFKTDPRICSNYDKNYVLKTWPAIQNFKGGNAIFTLPNTSVKCAGAPQKIMYLAEEAWRKSGVRNRTDVNFYTSLAVIFGVKKYANSLQKIISERNIKINYRMNLIEVRPETSEAVFQNLDSPTGEKKTVKYDFLHVCPPMSTPDPVRNSPLVDETGFVNVNKNTLQHVKFSNVFAVGDCSNMPTSKTAAAAASQGKVLLKNLMAAMEGKKLEAEYDGYTSCPLITSRGKCILAEFNFDCLPLETFPIDQGKERRSMYIVKRDILPKVYWNMMVKGLWNGPKFYRRLMHLGMDGPEAEK